VPLSMLERIAQQRKLLKAMAKQIEAVPQAWRGQKWKLFSDEYAKEQAKLQAMMARSKGKKTIVGGTLGAATAGALSEDESEAAVNPKGMWEILGREIKGFDDKRVLDYFRKSADEMFNLGVAGNQGEAYERAYLRREIAQNELRDRGIEVPHFKDPRFPETKYRSKLKDLPALNEPEVIDEPPSANDFLNMRDQFNVIEGGALGAANDKLDTLVGGDAKRLQSEDLAKSRRGEFKLVPPKKPPTGKIVAGLTAGGVGAGLTAMPAEAQQESQMPQGGSLFDRMRGRPYIDRYNQGEEMPGMESAGATHMPGMEGGEVNPTTGRLWDQMVGRPYVDRFSGQEQDMYDAFQGGMGGSGLSQEVEEGNNQARMLANQRFLSMFGGDPVIQQRIQELTTGGSQGGPQADFSDVESGVSSTAPDQIYPTAIPQTFEEMRNEFPPPSPGMIPQEQVEGDPEADRPWLGPGTQGIGEFGRRLGAYGKAMTERPVSGALTPIGETGAQIFEFLQTLQDPYMGTGPEAPPNPLRTATEFGKQRLIEADPENEDLVRRMVDAESLAMDPTWLGKGMEAVKLLSAGALGVGGALKLRQMSQASKAQRTFGKMQMGRAPSYGQAPRYNVNPPGATATRLPSATTYLGKASQSASKALAGIRSWVAPLGARFDVARLYKEKAAKRALTSGLAGHQQAFDNQVSAIQTGFSQHGRDLFDAMMTATGGDPGALKALGRQLWMASKVSKNPGLLTARLRGVDPAVRRAFDAANGFMPQQIDNLVRTGALSPSEVADYKEMFNGARFSFFDALRDPAHLEKVRGNQTWNQLAGLIKRANPNMNDVEIVGEMEGLLAEQVVKDFESTGKVSQAYLRTAPGIRSIVGYKGTDPLLRKLLGEVDDFPSAFHLSGEVIAKEIAQQQVGTRLIQDLYDVGIAGSTRAFGEKVPSHLVPRGQPTTYMPKEIIDAMKFGAEGVEAITNLNRAAAIWRVGKTVASPTSAGVLNYISGVTATIFSGHALSPTFWTVDLPDAFRASGQVIRRGTTQGARGFEQGVMRQGLGAGSISGEIGQYMRRAGMLPGYTGTSRLYEKVPRQLQGFTRGMARFFEQGDVVWKRAIAPRMVAENTVAMKNLHPADGPLLEQVFGTSDAVEMAGKQISDEFQSYQKASHKVKEISKRHPVFGPFITFTVEESRNAANHIAYLGKELYVAKYAQTPELRRLMLKRAMQHSVGIIAGATIPTAAISAIKTATGHAFTDEQEEVLEKRAIPGYEKGNVAFLGRNGDEISYSPLGRMIYFNDVLSLGKNGLQAVAHGIRGEWDQVGDEAIDMLINAATALTPYQEPLGSIYEMVTNQRLQGSLPETIAAGLRGQESKLVSTATSALGQIGERFTKSALPTLSPTPLLQAKRLLGGEGVQSVLPAGQVKRTSLAVAINRNSRELVDEKQNLFHARLSMLRHDNKMSLESKRKEIDKMRKDWETGLGQRVFDAVREWDKLLPRDRVLREFEGIGMYNVGAMLNEGRVPRFDEVFSESIPPEVRRR
jgi:hypothetical protein